MIEQFCPTCRARPGQSCVVPSGSRFPVLHLMRRRESGMWTLKYDHLHRELPEGKRFDVENPWRRVKKVA